MLFKKSGSMKSKGVASLIITLAFESVTVKYVGLCLGYSGTFDGWCLQFSNNNLLMGQLNHNLASSNFALSEGEHCCLIRWLESVAIEWCFY